MVAVGAVVAGDAGVGVVVPSAWVLVVVGDTVVVVVGGTVVPSTGREVDVAGIDVVDGAGDWVPGVALVVPQAVRASVARTVTMRRIDVSFLMNDDSVAA